MDIPKNKFKHRLANKEKLIGSWLMSGSPVISEAMGGVGFDYLVLDMEHVAIDVPDAMAMLQAIEATGTPALVRMVWNDMVLIKRILDAGAQSIMLPYVQDVDEARRAVSAARYPPKGVRGVAGLHRASRWGNVKNYLKEADDPSYAARVAIDLLVEEGRGGGGLILVDWRGRVGWANSTPLMPVGFMSPSHPAPELPF